jgi:virulence-associated protein VagC
MIKAQQTTPDPNLPNPSQGQSHYDNPMFNMMWNVIGQQFAKLPPTVKEALAQTEVDIIREADRVIIRPRPLVESENTYKVGQLLLDNFVEQLSPMIHKSFRVEVKVYR